MNFTQTHTTDTSPRISNHHQDNSLGQELAQMTIPFTPLPLSSLLFTGIPLSSSLFTELSCSPFTGWSLPNCPNTGTQSAPFMGPAVPNTGPYISPNTCASETNEKKSTLEPQSRILVESLLSEKVVTENIVTDIEVTERTITVHISPQLQDSYTLPDCHHRTIVSRYDSETIEIQGLGIQGKALRYIVETVHLSYHNDEGQFRILTVSASGFYRNLKVTDEVMEKAMYLIVDRNLSLRVAAEMLYDLYGVETSSSALDRWKEAQAEALPSIGQLIQQLNAKKKMTQLHLDEYKATGTKSWELCIKDEHGRLIFSIRLEKRDAWHIKVILRWLRILGLKIEVFYVDFWLAYPPAIKAIYPNAEIQFDFFHVIQNIHRHLYKDLTAYRKSLITDTPDKEEKKRQKELHAKLWRNRYLFFTNEENLSDEQKVRLDKLLEEHKGTILEQIVVFRWYIRDIFNHSDSYREAVEKLSFLVIEGWADLSEHFAKVMKFLQENFKNMVTYLRLTGVGRNSLAESTVRSLRRIERIRQGFKSDKGRANHLKLLIYRQYLSPNSASSH